jgi:hypothetical protein
MSTVDNHVVGDFLCNVSTSCMYLIELSLSGAVWKAGKREDRIVHFYNIDFQEGLDLNKLEWCTQVI